MLALRFVNGLSAASPSFLRFGICLRLSLSRRSREDRWWRPAAVIDVL